MQVDPVLGLVGFLVFTATIILVYVLWDTRRFVRKKEREIEKQGEHLPRSQKLVGYGWVLERIDDNNYELHTVKITSDGWAVAEKAGKSWLVRGRKPQLVFYRRWMVKRAIPLWITDGGNILEVKIDKDTLKAETKALPPELSYSVINSKLLSKVARVVGTDPMMLFYGLFLGLGLAVLLILVVLPALGIPVQIGSRPIQVHVELPKHVTQLPPPGNYTPG